MDKNKEILVYCPEGLLENALNKIKLLGHKTHMAEDDTDFLLKVNSSPDGIIVCRSMLSEYILSSFSAVNTSGKAIPTAVLLEDEASADIKELTKKGFSVFFTSDNCEEKTIEFAENILLSDTRKDVLVKALNRLRNLAENAHDGIIILDEDGTISYANKSAEVILKIKIKDIINKKLNDILQASTMECLSPTEEPQIYENQKINTINGTELLLNYTYSSNFEKNKYTGSVIIFSKVTDSVMDQKKELELLHFQEKYHYMQQNMAFQKQMLVLKDEMSNVISGRFAVETYFKPLDILSGDIYGSINIGGGKCLFYIIDAMGKGLSASVTALQSTSFINHSVELSIVKNDFDLKKTIDSFIYYIRDRLMEEEALCFIFFLLDTKNETAEIANYGMPPVYLTDKQGSVEIVRPNNLPVMRCIADKNCRTYDLKNIDKIMIMSDGLIETTTRDGSLYMDFIADHFRESVTKRHFLSKMRSLINKNTDDITFFLIKRSPFCEMNGADFTADTNLEGIYAASENITDYLRECGISETEIGSLEFGISEMLMNALEHGNLDIGYQEKQSLISSGLYDDFIAENTSAESGSEKKIHISVECKNSVPENEKAVYLRITDEGKGFSPAELFKYHSFDGNLCHIDSKSYNGRGIFITDNIVDGIFYSEKGNTACLVKMIKN